MTLKEIKTLFKPGEKWTCERHDPGLTIHGNTGTTVHPPRVVTEERTVHAVRSGDLVWERVADTELKRKLYTTWPKASEITEAAPGKLAFQYADGGVKVIFTKL